MLAPRHEVRRLTTFSRVAFDCPVQRQPLPVFMPQRYICAGHGEAPEVHLYKALVLMYSDSPVGHA
jgi:hypothetical protein